jgi:uncharacterized protein (TIGR00661 family)
MRVLFTIQGDGRGHMTQAIAAAQMLRRNGHEVVAATVGRNQSRVLPAFVQEALGMPLTEIESPGFSLQRGRGVAEWATFRQALAGLGHYRRSVSILRDLIAGEQPDLIVNFLEPLMGVYNLLFRHSIPVISVGHHFMVEHPEFVRSAYRPTKQWVMRQYVRLAGARSLKLALSFYPAADLPERGLVVCPPLLRRDLFALPQDVHGDFLLVYLLNPGYAGDILRWHALFPEIPIHCYCENPEAIPRSNRQNHLHLHRLDDVRFLQMMAQCRGVACTAGFETVNEAAWLGKPLVVMPVENHIEQYLNALDAAKAGLATPSDRFDLTPLLRHRPAANLGSYRAWVRRAEDVFLNTVETAVRAETRVVLPIGGRPSWESPVAVPAPH